MGNCCRRIENWLCPNPFEGIVIEALYAHNYTSHSVRFDTVEVQAKAQQKQAQQVAPLQPILPTLTVYTEMLPEKESADLDPLLKKPFLTPKTTPKTTPKSTPKSSPLYLGRPIVPPPPPFSLLEITKNKKLVIEY